MKSTQFPPYSQITLEDVADVLIRIAAMIDLAEDNPYRAHAYRRAARLVLNLPQPLHTLLDERGQFMVPGIGPGLRQKLGELVVTGRLRIGIELSARLPLAATAFLSLPGIGPVLARRLYDELGVTTLDEIITAAQTGQIRKLRGFGPRREARILAGALAQRAAHAVPDAAPQPIVVPLAPTSTAWPDAA